MAQLQRLLSCKDNITLSHFSGETGNLYFMQNLLIFKFWLHFSKILHSPETKHICNHMQLIGCQLYRLQLLASDCKSLLCVRVEERPKWNQKDLNVNIGLKFEILNKCLKWMLHIKHLSE
jgi:hypothetical protein